MNLSAVCEQTVYEPVPILKYSLNAYHNLRGQRGKKIKSSGNREVEKLKIGIRKEAKEEGSSKTRDLPRPFTLLYSVYRF